MGAEVSGDIVRDGGGVVSLYSVYQKLEKQCRSRPRRYGMFLTKSPSIASPDVCARGEAWTRDRNSLSAIRRMGGRQKPQKGCTDSVPS